MMTFGQQLQSLRKEKGYSQEQLAQQLYVTRQSVSLWENDRSLPSLDLLLKLSQIFDTSVDKLLGKEDEPEAPLTECFILTEKKDVRRASRFWYCSTITLLLASAFALIFLSVLSLNIHPAVYQNLRYVVSAEYLIRNSVVVGALILAAVWLLILRTRQWKCAHRFAQLLSGSISFYRDNLVLCDKDGTPTAFFYANLRRVYENDGYLTITLPNKQTVFLDKSNADDKLCAVTKLLSENKFYRRKHISSKKDVNVLFRQVLHNILFVAVITTTIASLNLTVMLRTNNALPLWLQWLMFLLPSETARLSLGVVRDAAMPLVYCGVFSSGIAYTLQNVAQSRTSASVAAIVLSTESVFGALSGWIVLHDVLSAGQFCGCALVFVAVVATQLLAARKTASAG